MRYIEQVSEASEYLKIRTNNTPKYGVILGTGQRWEERDFEIEITIPYSEIPHFPKATVESHKGALIFGKVNEQQVVVMSGRFHFYEGYDMKTVTFPIRVLKQLGIENLLMASAVGSCNPAIKTGDLVLVEDHINLQVSNPLIGENYEVFGPRFPDLANAYNEQMIVKAETFASENNITSHRGVYVAVTGPYLETRAEFRYFNLIGADVVGMSTVPEVLVARHMNLNVFVVAVVCNEGYANKGEKLPKMTLEEIVNNANVVAPKAAAMIRALIG